MAMWCTKFKQHVNLAFYWWTTSLMGRRFVCLVMDRFGRVQSSEEASKTLSWRITTKVLENRSAEGGKTVPLKIFDVNLNFCETLNIPMFELAHFMSISIIHLSDTTARQIFSVKYNYNFFLQCNFTSTILEGLRDDEDAAKRKFFLKKGNRDIVIKKGFRCRGYGNIQTSKQPGLAVLLDNSIDLLPEDVPAHLLPGGEPDPGDHRQPDPLPEADLPAPAIVLEAGAGMDRAGVGIDQTGAITSS